MPEGQQQKNALLIAASLIAAVRTAREDKILPTSPRVLNRVKDSIRLARLVLEQVEREP